MGWWCTAVDPVRPGRPIEPDTVGTRSPPLDMAARAPREHPATFVACIPKGEVLGRAGACVTPEGRLLLDASAHLGLRSANEHRAFTGYLAAPPARAVRGRVAVLAAASAGNYYHWLLDALPRLRLIERAGIALESIDGFVVPDTGLRAVEETLALAGIGPGRLLRMRHLSRIRADELVVPSLAGRSGSPTPESVAMLRERFAGRTTGQPAEGRRLLVERAGRRIITNGAEIRAIAARHGFEAVRMEGLTFERQASLFAGARAVAGVHGAALTNLAFCAPGTRVLELLAPTYANGCYAVLCAEAGLGYGYLLGRGTPSDRAHDRWADMTIDPALADMALARLADGH